MTPVPRVCPPGIQPPWHLCSGVASALSCSNAEVVPGTPASVGGQILALPRGRVATGPNGHSPARAPNAVVVGVLTSWKGKVCPRVCMSLHMCVSVKGSVCGVSVCLCVCLRVWLSDAEL